jgi:hypothetical protein
VSSRGARGGAHRPCAYHGLHSFAVEFATHAGAAYAKSVASIDSLSSVRYPIKLALVIRVTKGNINFKRGVSLLVVLAV